MGLQLLGALINHKSKVQCKAIVSEYKETGIRKVSKTNFRNADELSKCC